MSFIRILTKCQFLLYEWSFKLYFFEYFETCQKSTTYSRVTAEKAGLYCQKYKLKVTGRQVHQSPFLISKFVSRYDFLKNRNFFFIFIFSRFRALAPPP